MAFGNFHKNPWEILKAFKEVLERFDVKGVWRGPGFAPRFQQLGRKALNLKGKGKGNGKGKSRGNGKTNSKPVAASEGQGSSGSRDTQDPSPTKGVKRNR